MGIERDLHDLLYCHDCVIVPHWGGFLTHYRSASLDEGRQLVHPPGKDVSFNKNLDRNDGLLADHIAKRSGTSFNDARTSIELAVKEWRHALDHKGRLELPQIGIFYCDAERNLQFDPDRRSNFLKDAHGLRPLPAIPVKQGKEAIVRAVPVPTDGLTTYERRTTFIWAAAAMAAVIFGAAAFWAYKLGEPQGGQWSGLDPFGEAVRATYVPAKFIPIEVAVFAGLELPEEPLGVKEIALSEDPNDRIMVDLGSPAPIASADSTAVSMPEKVKEVPAINARFHVIGGCFAEDENAERFLQDLQGKGFPARRLPQYGKLHPVAFGSYVRREEALQAMASMRDKGITAAWLLVR